jgi:flagellar basal body rod protein FlgC
MITRSVSIMKIRTDTVVSEAAYDPKHIKTPTRLIK